MKKRMVEVSLGYHDISLYKTLPELISKLQEIQDGYQEEYDDVHCSINFQEDSDPYETSYTYALELHGHRLETDREFAEKKKRLAKVRLGGKKRVVKQKEQKIKDELKTLAKLKKKYPEE